MDHMTERVADDWVARLVGSQQDSVPARWEPVEPEVVRAAIARHPEHVVSIVMLSKGLPDALADSLACHPDPAVRAALAAKNLLGRTPEAAAILARDPVPAVREAVARNRKVPSALRDSLLTDPDPQVRYAAALHR